MPVSQRQPEPNRDSQLALLSQFIQAGPLYGRKGQERCAAMLYDRLVSLGWDDVWLQHYTSGQLAQDIHRVPVESFGSEYLHDANKPKTNVLGILRSTNPGPTLILNGHYDVEPIADPSAWHEKWNSGRLAAGKIWGRGAADMLGGLTAMLYAATDLASDRTSWAGRIIFVAVTDEEIGGNGTLAALHELSQKGMLKDPSSIACLIAEPSDNIIGNSSVGFMHMRLISQGQSRHLTESRIKDNALHIMLDAVQNFGATLDKAAKAVNANIQEFMYNFGTIAGGLDAATPIGQVESEATIFYPKGVVSSELQHSLKKCLSSYGKSLEVTFPGFTFDGHHSAKSSLGEALFANRPTSAIQSGTFKSPCDARLFEQFGINDVIVYGPGSLAQAHAANEYISVRELNAYTIHLRTTLRDYLKP